MIRFLFAVALVVSFAAAAAAQVTSPIRYTWIATSCENWNCAVAALVMADGSPGVIALPTNRDAFTCEVFENVTAATSRFTALDGCHAPMILNVPDGRAIVTSLQNCGSGKKRRAAG